ncbi:MAG: hypothetical protein PVH55_05550, partial [Desulfobacterales bacterium]
YLIKGISKKILALKNDIIKIEMAPKKPEVSPKIQDLIKKMVSFSPDKNEDFKALDGAIALAKFGQLKRAISEFNELIKKDSLRVVAAKNMIRCHVALSSLDEAVAQYEQWISDDRFSTIQMDNLLVFLENILKKEGIEKKLPRRKTAKDDTGVIWVKGPEIEDDDSIDINAIRIPIYRGPKKGQIVEFNVRFQLRNVLSLLISIRDRELIDIFKVGDMINDIQYYSTAVLFNASGLVISVKEIKIGPFRGDYCMDIKIVLDQS